MSQPAESKALISQFCNVAHVTQAEASVFLQNANWDLDRALLNFFGDQPSKSNKQQPQRGILSFSDIKQAEQKHQGNEYYAGGEKSGIAVQGPPKDGGDISDFFEKAKQKGEMLSPSQMKSNDSWGSSNANNSIVKVVFYKNGFVVGEDGVLREYDHPSSKQFLHDITHQEVPAELIAKYPKQDVLVDIVDKRAEVYTPPKPQLKTFSGAGYVLGADTPSPQASSSSSSSSAAPSPSPSSSDFKLDTNQPVTSIQIKLHDGSRLVGKFNHTHTVNDIKKYINMTKPQNGNYNLMTSFPPVVLSDPNATIAQAGLLNSVLMQKY